MAPKLWWQLPGWIYVEQAVQLDHQTVELENANVDDHYMSGMKGTMVKFYLLLVAWFIHVYPIYLEMWAGCQL